MALVRSDPFREFDRLVQHLWSSDGGSRPSAFTMPMDAYRKDDRFLVQLDLPGVEAESIDLTVEDNVLSVRAERLSPWTTEGVETLVAERPFGVFSRQMFLGDNLDTEHIEAHYDNGVLHLSIPVAAQAKARRIEVTREREPERLTAEPGRSGEGAAIDA